MGTRRLLKCVGFVLLGIYTCFIVLFAILVTNVKVDGLSTNALDLPFFVAIWPAVIIISRVLICRALRSQEYRLISILGSIGLLVLCVYGTWWAVNRLAVDQKFEAVKTEAWGINRTSLVSGVPMARKLLPEEQILCVRRDIRGSIDYWDAVPVGVVTSKLAKIPRRAEDITVVVLIVQVPISVASYSDQSTHYQWRFGVTVIDWKTRCVIGHHSFEGGMPSTPSGKLNSYFEGNVYGSQPWDLIRMWLYEGKVPTDK